MALHKHAIQLSERGMRVIHFPLVRLVVAISVLMLGNTIAYYLTQGLLSLIPSEPFEYFNEGIRVLFMCAFSILAYWAYVSIYEGREVSELSRSSLFAQLGLGLVLGFVFITVIIFIISLLGGYSFLGWNKIGIMLPVLIMSIQAGIVEEIMTRGVLFRIVEDGLGTWLSVLISALVFGFLHIWNPNATVFSSLSIAMTAGVILALFYVLTRKLWIPIGIHIAWNFTLGGIYGAPVSGGKAQGIIISEMNGSELLTGGAFGPEASIVTVIFFLILGVFLARKVINKNAIKLPMWISKNHSIKL